MSEGTMLDEAPVETMPAEAPVKGPVAEGSVLKNADTQQVQGSLALLMRSRVPIPVGLYFGKMRSQIKAQLEQIKEFTDAEIDRLSGGGKEIERFLDEEQKEVNPAFTEYQERFSDLMKETFVVALPKGPVPLYVGEEKGEPVYSWATNGGFKVEATEGITDAIFFVLEAGLIELVDRPKKEASE